MNLIGGCCGTSVAAHRGAGCDAAAARRTFRPTPVPRKPVWVPGVASLYQAVPLRQENAFFAIGERCNANGSRKWRGVAGKARLGRLRRDGPRAGRRGLQRAGCLHRLRRPRRDGRDDRGDPPLHLIGERAAGDRQHRDAGDRGGAEAAWRQADHQLDQFRGWREARRGPAGAGEAVRRRGDRADHRRDGHGEDRRAEAGSRAAAGGISPAISTGCRNRIC